MTAPDGDSLDGFVFPPFIPRAAQPPQPPAEAPAPPSAAPPSASEPEPQPMPWDAADAPAAAGAPEPAAAVAEEPQGEDDGGGDDLPWLEPPAPPTATAEPPAPAPAAEVGSLPEWMTWDEASEASVQDEVSAAAPLEGLQPFDSGPEDASAAAPGDADPFTAAAVTEAEAAEPEPAPAPPAPAAAAPQSSGAYGDVAARLESIARALREDPQQLLSGAANDPLGMLVTAYVLGYTHGRGNG
ncbi:MAG TPA: hypothetical protein VFQ45_09475 [Longimicrobium sp.]|nr:hypothetical protein [Longimicrobium sp.]